MPLAAFVFGTVDCIHKASTVTCASKNACYPRPQVDPGKGAGKTQLLALIEFFLGLFLQVGVTFAVLSCELKVAKQKS